MEIQLYQDTDDEYWELIMDSVFPDWRNMASSFHTPEEYSSWLDQKFDEALELTDFEFVDPPTYH